MTEFMDLLNTNSGAFTVFFSGLVTAATIVYAILTWKLVSETRLLREVQTEPRIEVSLKSLDIAIHLVKVHVKNVGLGPALDINFDVSVIEGGDSGAKLVEDFSKTEFLKAGIAYLGAGQERISGYTAMTEDYEGKIKSVMRIGMSYTSATGKSYSDICMLDMSEHKGTYQLGKPHLYSIAQSLEKIEKDTHDLVTGFRRLKIDTFTAEDRAEEQHRMEKQRQEFLESQKAKQDNNANSKES